MTQIEPKALLARYKHSLKQKEGFKNLYQSAFKYAMPERNNFIDASPGQKKIQDLYDSTGIIATDKFVNRMQSSLTPPFKKWVDLKAGSGIRKELKKQVNEALDTITEVIFDTIGDSNFHVCMSEFYYDLAAGTACMMVLPGEEDDQPLNFVSMPIEQISIEEGAYGSVGSIFRTQKIMGMLVEKTWKDAKLPAEVKIDIKANPTSEIKFIEVFYKNKGKHYYDVIIENSGERIVSRLYPVQRVICTRLGKIAGEDWGRGALIKATPDLNMLNKAKELGIRSGELNAYGMYTVADKDVINPNTLVLRPGMFIPVARNAGTNGPSIAALPQAGNLNIQQFMIQELQDNIKSMLLNNPLPPVSGAVRSPTEFITRTQEFALDTASYYGRLVYEFVKPLLQAIISILDEKGLIQVPPELARINNVYVKIHVLSPIAKEQGYEDVQSVARASEMLGAIGGQESVMLAYKIEDMGEYIGEKLGVPAKLMRTEKERKEMMQKAQQAQQEAAMQQQGVNNNGSGNAALAI